MRTKINITSEIISPLGNLELFQEQIQRNTYYTTQAKPYEDYQSCSKRKEILSADEKN
jgi:hypothetical protein